MNVFPKGYPQNNAPQVASNASSALAGQVLTASGPGVDPTFSLASIPSGVIKADGSVAFTADQSMGSHKLTNVTDPVSNQDAATKAYVTNSIVAANNPRVGYTIFEDFLGGGVFLGGSPAGGGGIFQLRDKSVGGSCGDAGYVDDTSPGIAKISADNANYGSLQSGKLGLFLTGSFISSIEFRVYVPVLSTGGDRFTLRIGLTDQTNTGGDPNNGVFFRYCDNVSSGKWQCVNRAGSVETESDAGSGPSAGTWVRLKIILGTTTVQFFVGAVASATLNTNVPSAIALGHELTNVKSVGATNRDLYNDYISYTCANTGR